MTRKERQEAIAQLERISRNLASIGETVDYTEFAIEALEQEPKIIPIAEIKFDDEMLHEIVEEAVKNIEIEPKWIPCSEKLPEIDTTNGFKASDVVLVCLVDRKQHMAFYCDDKKWRFCESGEAKEPMWDKVIAWQPLPEPYKESEVEE